MKLLNRATLWLLMVCVMGPLLIRAENPYLEKLQNTFLPGETEEKDIYMQAYTCGPFTLLHVNANRNYWDWAFAKDMAGKRLLNRTWHLMTRDEAAMICRMTIDDDRNPLPWSCWGSKEDTVMKFITTDTEDMEYVVSQGSRSFHSVMLIMDGGQEPIPKEKKLVRLILESKKVDYTQPVPPATGSVKSRELIDRPNAFKTTERRRNSRAAATKEAAYKAMETELDAYFVLVRKNYTDVMYVMEEPAHYVNEGSPDPEWVCYVNVTWSGFVKARARTGTGGAVEK